VNTLTGAATPIGDSGLGLGADGGLTFIAATPVDTEAPSVDDSEDITAEATRSDGAFVNYTVPGATDDVDGPVAVTCAPGSGFLFGLGITSVTCEATDAADNTGSSTFNITVVDTTPPDLTVPLDIAVTGSGGAVVSYNVSAIDIVDHSVWVECTPPSGSTFSIGRTTVLCTATDNSGNARHAIFAVTVEEPADTTPPVITSIGQSAAMLWPPNHKMVPVIFVVTATDAIDPSPSCQIVGVTSDEPINGLGDGDTAPDWSFTGLVAQLRSERGGRGSGRVYTVTVRCVDDAGNASTATSIVSVPKSMGK